MCWINWWPLNSLPSFYTFLPSFPSFSLPHSRSHTLYHSPSHSLLILSNFNSLYLSLSLSLSLSLLSLFLSLSSLSLSLSLSHSLYLPLHLLLLEGIFIGNRFSFERLNFSNLCHNLLKWKTLINIFFKNGVV